LRNIAPPPASHLTYEQQVLQGVQETVRDFITTTTSHGRTFSEALRKHVENKLGVVYEGNARHRLDAIAISVCQQIADEATSQQPPELPLPAQRPSMQPPFRATVQPTLQLAAAAATAAAPEENAPPAMPTPPDAPTTLMLTPVADMAIELWQHLVTAPPPRGSPLPQTGGTTPPPQTGGLHQPTARSTPPPQTGGLQQCAGPDPLCLLVNAGPRRRATRGPPGVR